MSEFYPERAVPLLIEALNDAHFIVRENAADELGELEAVEALPFLRAKLEDAHPHVRQAAETAIEMLTPLLETEMADAEDVQVSMTLSKEAIYWRRFKLRKDYLTLMKKKLYEQFGVRSWGFGVRGLASSCSSQTGLKSTEKTLKTSF